MNFKMDSIPLDIYEGEEDDVYCERKHHYTLRIGSIINFFFFFSAELVYVRINKTVERWYWNLGVRRERSELFIYL
jgi:hypothetical protein